jgi:hypothetical protein
MERLTKRINGKLTLTKQFPSITDTLDIVANRLELYEDTSLSPEEVSRLCLIKLADDCVNGLKERATKAEATNERLFKAINNAIKDIGEISCQPNTSNGEHKINAWHTLSMALRFADHNPIAEQEGHCVVLPAVDNQTVYCIMPQLKENIIHEVFITTVEISYTLKDGIRFLGIMDDIDDWECYLSDFGKHVFITREAAETALKTIESA